MRIGGGTVSAAARRCCWLHEEKQVNKDVSLGRAEGEEDGLSESLAESGQSRDPAWARDGEQIVSDLPSEGQLDMWRISSKFPKPTQGPTILQQAASSRWAPMEIALRQQELPFSQPCHLMCATGAFRRIRVQQT